MTHMTDQPATGGAGSFDVVIVGGGCTGSATAWHLLEMAPGISVVVVEPDLSYHLASTSVASGGVRQLFTRPENIRMSQYTHEVIERWDRWTPQGAVADVETAPPLDWRPNGYLFIADQGTRSSQQLERDHAQHLALGVDAVWLEPEDVANRFGHIRVDDLGPAILSPRDGWLDPGAFLAGMQSRSRALGASFLPDEVVGFELEDRRVNAVALASGRSVRGDVVVNVAGVWGPALSSQLGLELPVEPMRRFDHYAQTSADVASYPFVKDPAGLAVRPEGTGITAAVVDFSHPGGHDLSIDPTYFDAVVQPALSQRFPALADAELVSTWAGLYQQNRLDGNMIIDRWTGHLDNYLFATGFSGHGLMHSPAVGRALSELIVHGAYRSIDLTRMGLDRVLTETPYAELAVR